MQYSIDEWVQESPADKIAFRKSVHIILNAIGSSEYLKPLMIMKGGILLAIRYKSPRFTTDIDFSTKEKLINIDKDEFRAELNDSLLASGVDLSYGITCKVQYLKIQPKEDAEFPSFNLKIAYAHNLKTSEMRRLDRGESPNVVKIDYSFNEITYNTDEIELEDDESVISYSFTDLVAEKIRSIIQQPYRKRKRRQDVYDLNFLLKDDISDIEKLQILDTLLKKSKGRIPLEDVNIETLNRQDIISMSREDYHLLKDEIPGDLPIFEDLYTTLLHFYRSLPWDICEGE